MKHASSLSWSLQLVVNIKLLSPNSWLKRGTSIAKYSVTVSGFKWESLEQKKEKWQLQHFSNYFHTERSLSRSAAPLFGFVCFGALLMLGCRYHTWFMTGSSVQKELRVVLGWGLSARCYLTRQQAYEGARAHARTHAHANPAHSTPPLFLDFLFICNQTHLSENMFFFTTTLARSHVYSYMHARMNGLILSRTKTDAEHMQQT